MKIIVNEITLENVTMFRLTRAMLIHHQNITDSGYSIGLLGAEVLRMTCYQRTESLIS